MYAFSVSDPQQSKNPLVYVSPGFETLSGYSSEEVLGNNCKLLQVRLQLRSGLPSCSQVQHGVPPALRSDIDLPPVQAACHSKSTSTGTMHLLQGKNPDKDKVSVLRSGMEGRSFTSCQLTNYRRDGKAFQNLLCIVPFLDAYDNLLKFIGEVLVKHQ
jgi:hypothetical protein